MKKVCIKCGIEKDLSMFQSRRSTKDGYRNECKVCRSTYDHLYYSKRENKDRRLKRQMDRYWENRGEYLRLMFFRTYGITQEEKDKMVSTQGNRCAICHNEFRSSKDTCLDQRHSTGEIRGILCCKCNQALGLLDENIEIIKNLIKYVEKNNEKDKITSNL